MSCNTNYIEYHYGSCFKDISMFIQLPVNERLHLPVVRNCKQKNCKSKNCKTEKLQTGKLQTNIFQTEK